MSQDGMVGSLPHGGKLVNREVALEKRAEARQRAAGLPMVELNARSASDLLLLSTGAFSPLEGFMDHDTAGSVVEDFSLGDGTLWSLPILLQVDRAQADAAEPGREVALRYNGSMLGTLRIGERFRIPREEWAKEIFRTLEDKHPGVAAFLTGGEFALSGEVSWFGDDAALDLDSLWITPAETRAELARRGWRTVAGFQTRNPIHRAHEYVLRTALEVTEGLLLHPLVGETRSEDIPASIRLRCYEALLTHYLPRERVLFSVLPAWMRYGGPREALHHALVRKNFGCTHFLVGRDHAGVGNCYHPFAAQELLRSLSGTRLGIEPIFFDEVFYCHRCESMASARTCAHGEDTRLKLSGTEVRRRLREGLPLPSNFTRPEVAEILSEAYRSAGAAQPA
jgi:sulfate adenylyltransferase